MTDLVYKFDINLLKLSKSDHLPIAKTEWREIYREQRAEKTGLCICQHTLKNVIYMYNIYTKYTISVGTGCCKKFNLKLIKLDSNILENVIREMLIKGEYTIIDNILEYTNCIQSQLLKYIKTEYEYCMTSLEKLRKLHNDIKMLIENYEMIYLHDIYNELTDKIIREEHICFERKEKERIELQRRKREQAEIERKKNECIELQRKEKEQVEIERKKNECIELQRRKREQAEIERKKNECIELQRKEKEQVEIERKKNECIELQRKEKFEKTNCACGIIKENICTCKTPKYELVKLSNNLYCMRCSKWKCRCTFPINS